MVKKISLFLVLIFIILPRIVEAQIDDKQWLFNQINSLRSQAGVHAYAWNDQLAAAAQQHSEYMASTGDISHQQSNGSMPADRAAANGYNGSWISENIYGGSIAQATDAWNFWLNSSVHYAGMVNRNTNEIGIGVARNADGGGYYTLVFGYRSGVEEPISPPLSVENTPIAVAEVPQQAAPPPTRRPPTFTPTATVPTLTPSVTWTVTPTWTSSPTLTPVPPSSTPLVLPTAAVVVAQVPTEESEKSPEIVVTSPSQIAVESDEDSDLQDLLPYLLIGQVILIGIGAFSIFIRRKHG